MTRIDLTDAMKGSRKEQLEALRDYITAGLEGKRCTSCEISKLKNGEQTSLIKLLKDVTQELDAMKAAEDKSGRLGAIRGGMPGNVVDMHERRHAVPDRRPGGGRKPAV